MMEILERDGLCFPELLNASCRRLVRPRYEAVSLYILGSALSVLTVILNLLVIISISHFRQLHTPTNFVLLSLAVSDFLVGLVVMPVELIRCITSCWFLGDIMCDLFSLLVLILVSSSVGSMMLISADRYVAICEPFQYPNKITIRRIQITVCVTWVCSVSYNIVILQTGLSRADRGSTCYGECNVVITYVAGVIDSVLTFIGPVTVIIILYGKVFVVAVSQARAMKTHPFRTVQLGTANKSELKAARTLGTVILVFLLCFCPYFYPTFAGGDNDTAFALPFFLWLMYLNSCINPLIYAIFYPWFKKAIQLIITLQILRPGSSEINILSIETKFKFKCVIQ